MLSPRIRRLKLDYDTLTQRFRNWPLIQVSGTAGMPPEVYRITFQVKGLYVSQTGEILERDTHQLEVSLSLGYPRRAPQCRMLAPVFHPNFDEGSVCIGDFWAASEGLDDLIVRIGRMIAYQEYNAKSPLNGLAAKWATQHARFFPVDPRDIAPPLDRPQPASDLTATQVPGQSSVAQQSSTEEATPAVIDRNAATNVNLESPLPDPWADRITIE